MQRSQKERYEVIGKNLEKNTGRSLEQWMEVVKRKAPKDRDDQINLLKIEHRLDPGQAKMIVKMMHEGLADYDERDLIEQHFNKGKEYQKAIYDKIVSILKKVRRYSVSVNKTYISFIHNQQFALVKTTRAGLVVGVPAAAVKSAKSKEFIPAKNLGSEKITHKILMNDENEVTDSVIKVLKASYDNS